MEVLGACVMEKIKKIEDLKFPDIFDGIYLGACATGLELIVVLICSLIYFFVFVQDVFASYLIAVLFLTNISFVIFLKHIKAFQYSVWKEVTSENKKVQRGDKNVSRKKRV